MHAAYNFNFLETISQQLKSSLDALTITPLNAGSLAVLLADQVRLSARQGVYQLYLGNDLVYLGKADDVAYRLDEHLTKLSGRNGVHLPSVGYKALLLDRSMSTAANENVLIGLFLPTNPQMWNGKGFGPKDPGKERDTTRPNYFDTKYPIRSDYPVPGVEDHESIGSLLGKLKAALPFVFRYGLDGKSPVSALVVDLTGVPRTAEDLLQAALRVLGAGWKGAILAFGMVLYETTKDYPYGKTLLP